MAKILFVDDSRSMRRLVHDCLVGSGHTVTVSEDGEVGLKEVLNASYDLIISDINMPNMNGITFIEKVRQIPAYKITPILILTTESSDEKKKEGKQVGATGWIVKPFNPEKLIMAINRVCK